MLYLLRIILFLIILPNCQADDLIVVTEEAPPYNFSKGDLVLGYSTEIVQQVLDHAKLNYLIHVYPWARAYDMALKEPNTLIYTIVRTPERENLFQWIGPILPGKRFSFYKLKSRTDITLKDINDVKKYKLGTVKDDVPHHFLSGYGFKENKNFILMRDQTLNLSKLYSNRLDLIIDEESVLPTRLKNLNLDPNKVTTALFAFEFGYYFALSAQSDEDLYLKIQQSFKEVFTLELQQSTAHKYGITLTHSP